MQLLEFVNKYWAILLFIGGSIWGGMKFMFNYKMREVKQKLVDLEAHMLLHDKSDKDIYDNLSALIATNKKATEDHAKKINENLQTVMTQVAVANNNITWLVQQSKKD